ncbi:MAG: thiamine phosphate synthase [Pseudomonadota bacterium]
MPAPDQPQLYLITPTAFDLQSFPDVLASVLDAHEIACVRLSMTSQDADLVARAADALREITHARDIALVIAEHIQLVTRLGLDGVHLSDASKSVRAARKALEGDVIVGSHCGTSKHDGMSAGEAGADYIAFGPVRASELGDGGFVPSDLFSWWSEVVEVPCVAEGGLDLDHVARLAPYTDFFGIGDEIWGQDDPKTALTNLIAPLR